MSKSSKGPIIAFFGVLIAGVTASLIYLGPRIVETVEVTEPAEPELTEPAYAPAPAPEKEDRPEPDSEKKAAAAPEKAAGGETTSMTVEEVGAPGQPAAPSPYVTATALVADLAARLQKGDITGFLDLAGKNVVSEEMKQQLRHLIVDSGYRLQPGEAALEQQDAGTGVRHWSITLVPPDELKPLGEQALNLVLRRGAASGWEIAALKVPDIGAVTKRFENAAPPATMAETPANVMPADPKTAVSVAQSFVDSVVRRDFQAARKLVDPELLSDEKLAALFIVVEEGKFRLPGTSPLVSTVDQGPRAWIIARLTAPDTNSEFGMELARNDDDTWSVTGLHMSQLLQARAMEAGAGDVAYAPIKTDLKDGDSLVLYFEYDEDQVNTRARKQLEIIAEILMSDPARQLHINGHADAMGEEDYNELLSDHRAVNVRRQLLALGVPPKQIVTQAFGESSPKAPNILPDGSDNPSGRSLNRRAEVYLRF